MPWALPNLIVANVVRRWLREARIDVDAAGHDDGIPSAKLDKLIAGTGQPDTPELRNQYEKIKSQFGNGKEYRVSHILVEKEDEAKAIIAKIKGGAKSEDMAKASSKDPGSATNGGDLDWANSGSYVPEFSAAMTGLKKGQMTETPVKSQFGWHVILLVDERETKIPSFEEVKPQLQQMLMGDQNWQREQFQAMMKSLRDQAKI